MTTSQRTSSAFGSLKSLGRGIAVSSAVALMGVTSMSAADAAEAGVATGVRYAGATSTHRAAATPTSLQIDSKAAYRIRDGRITRA